MYHKPTHTDQYLQWDSHHNLSAQYSVIGTLTHRANTVCTRPELFQRELQHLREALVKSNTHTWPSIGYKADILTVTGRITLTPTICKTIPPPMLAGIKPIQAGIATTHHYKTCTIQMQAQKKSLHKAKTQYRICGHSLYTRNSRKF